MLHYFKDEHGKLHCVAGDIDISNQKDARRHIEQETNFRVKTAVLTLVVDNLPLDDTMIA